MIHQYLQQPLSIAQSGKKCPCLYRNLCWNPAYLLALPPFGDNAPTPTLRGVPGQLEASVCSSPSSKSLPPGGASVSWLGVLGAGPPLLAPLQVGVAGQGYQSSSVLN